MLREMEPVGYSLESRDILIDILQGPPSKGYKLYSKLSACSRICPLMRALD